MKTLYLNIVLLLAIFPLIGRAQDSTLMFRHDIGKGASPYSYTLLPGTNLASSGNGRYINSLGYWYLDGNIYHNGISLVAPGSATEASVTLDVHVASPTTISAFSINTLSSFGGFTKWKLFIDNTQVADGDMFVADSLNFDSLAMLNTGIIYLTTPLTLTGASVFKVTAFDATSQQPRRIDFDNPVVYKLDDGTVNPIPNAPNDQVSPSGNTTNPEVSSTAPPALVLPSNNKLNFVRTWVPQKPITDANSDEFTRAPSLTLKYTTQLLTTYLDGWDRTMETIKRGSPSTPYGGKDIITGSENAASFTTRSFLPYKSGNVANRFITDVFGQQKSYYQSNFSTENGLGYGQTIVSNDVFQKNTTRSYEPGKLLIGQQRGTTVTTTLNDPANALYNTPMFSSMFGTGTTGSYRANELIVNTTTNDNGTKILEFFDKDNRKVCKKVLYTTDPPPPGFLVGYTQYLTTYYSYNYLGQLSSVITPSATTWNTFYNDKKYVYNYYYDKFGKLIKRFTPGKDDDGLGEYMVYDTKHRQVLYQSPALRAQNKYKFTIYDERDRVVMEGYLSSTVSPITWQNTINDPPQFVWNLELLYYFLYDFARAYPSSIQGCEITNVYYYDRYPAGSPSFDATTANDLATTSASGLGANLAPSKPYLFMHGMLAATKTRVRDPYNVGSITNEWITTTYFYDQKGNLIQTQSLNPWYDANNGNSYPDISNSIYNFSGQKIRESWVYHDDPNVTSNKPVLKITKQYTYEAHNGGKLTFVKQSIDNGPAMLIASYKYDEFGRVKEKSLGGVETQRYDYNIRGELTGINSGYTRNGSSSSASANTTFGCVLGYDYGFTVPRYDGKISGMYWRGAGGNSARIKTYAYDYDKAGRLIGAPFKEKQSGQSTGQYNNATHDYSVSNVKYDYNGNLTSMNQRGTTTNPVDMDILTYRYDGNRVSSITDQVTANYNLGDFVNDGCVPLPPLYNNCTDYTYDADGNLTSDVNKDITSITYNEMNAPILIMFGNGNSINNIYDGSGTLVKKYVTDAVNSTTDVYRYTGGLTYKNNELQYALHDEGRARWDATNQQFLYDFFVKDHLDNVRNVVTAEPHPASYTASFEVANAQVEEAQFSTLGAVRSINPYGVSAANSYTALLNGDPTDSPTKAVGTSILLHVMAGDKIDVSALSYWEQDNEEYTYATPEAMLDNLFNTLAGGEIGNYVPENSSYIETMGQVQNTMWTNAYNYQDIIEGVTNPDAPRAYINYIVFDESMNMVPEKSGAIQVSTASNEWQSMDLTDAISIDAGGYILAYISNAQYKNVWFDNFNVVLYKGKLLQEQHYYPYGLCVNLDETNDQPKNKFKYQGKEHQNELGLHWDDFHARQYDPQVGRFWSVDPAQQFPSGYIGMGDDPANKVDPTGLAAQGQGGGSSGTSMAGGLFNPSLGNPLSIDEPVTDYETLPHELFAYAHKGGGGTGGGNLSGIGIYNDWGDFMDQMHNAGKLVLTEKSFMRLQAWRSASAGLSSSLEEYTNVSLANNYGAYSRYNSPQGGIYAANPFPLSMIEEPDFSWNAGGQNSGGNSMWPHLIGPGVGFFTWPWVPKRFVMPNSSNATTLLSKALGEVRIPTRIIGKSRLYTHTVNGIPRYTTNLGKFAGRWGSKILGRLSLYYTLWDITYNLPEWIYEEATGEEVKPSWMAEAGVCFKEGTLVYCQTNFLEINNLKVGDSVYSFNLATEKMELVQVIKTYRRIVEEIGEMKIGDEILWVTKEHPFYVARKGWVKAMDLEDGDKIKTASDEKIFKSYVLHSEKMTVYNIEVAGNHNYFVTPTMLLVHNKYISEPQIDNNKKVSNKNHANQNGK